jgi:hypothetical protein
METNSFDLKDVEKLIQEFEELFLKPPFMISEVANFVETLVMIYRNNAELGSARLQTNVIETWEYVDEKYRLSEKFDKSLTLPEWLEPLDGLALDLLVKHVIVPVATKLAFRSPTA